MYLLVFYILVVMSPLLECSRVDEGYQISKNHTSPLGHDRGFGEKCGLKRAKPNFTHKIVGGTTASSTEFPWMVKLIYVKNEVRRFGCAGSLVNPSHVLTAAHCVSMVPRKKRLLGDLNLVELGLAVPGQAMSLQRIRIDKSIWHKQFSVPGNFANDIALLRLEKRAMLNKFIQPVRLYTEEVPANSQLWVSGWGRTKTQSHSPAKMKVSVPLVGFQQCRKIWRSFRMTVSRKQICAGGEPGEDSCNGDSGGPLMLFKDGKWFVVGLVSYGSPTCGEPGVPAVHTKISEYIDWIKAHAFIKH